VHRRNESEISPFCSAGGNPLPLKCRYRFISLSKPEIRKALFKYRVTRGGYSSSFERSLRLLFLLMRGIIIIPVKRTKSTYAGDINRRGVCGYILEAGYLLYGRDSFSNAAIPLRHQLAEVASQSSRASRPSHRRRWLFSFREIAKIFPDCCRHSLTSLRASPGVQSKRGM